MDFDYDGMIIILRLELYLNLFFRNYPVISFDLVLPTILILSSSLRNNEYRSGFPLKPLFHFIFGNKFTSINIYHILVVVFVWTFLS